jgi:membrane-associated phospholipid phosphatase
VTLTRAPSNDIKAAPQTGSAAGSPGGSPALLKDTFNTLAQWLAALARPPRAHPPRPPAMAYAAAAVTLLVIIASMFFLDTAASDWAKHLPLPLTDAFEEITNFGLSGWFLIPFGFAVLVLAAAISPALPHISRAVLASLAARFGFLFLAIAAPGLFVTIVKRLIGRARPYVGSFDDPFAYLPFVWRPEYASMPSGHATTAASAAIAIGAIWPRARGVMWLYALIIMLSRVIVLAHHPSDVVAGGLVGVLGAFLVRRWFAARCLVFSSVNLRAFPGPSLRRIGAALRRAMACR